MVLLSGRLDQLVIHVGVLVEKIEAPMEPQGIDLELSSTAAADIVGCGRLVRAQEGVMPRADMTAIDLMYSGESIRCVVVFD